MIRTDRTLPPANMPVAARLLAAVIAIGMVLAFTTWSIRYHHRLHATPTAVIRTP